MECLIFPPTVKILQINPCKRTIDFRGNNQTADFILPLLRRLFFGFDKKTYCKNRFSGNALQEMSFGKIR